MTVPSREVMKFQTSHPGPPHLKKTATIRFTGSKGGKDNWITELKLAVEEWHATRDSTASKRIAVEVGTKPQRLEVCTLLQGLKVPFLHYDGDSDGTDKIKLSDPGKE
eukprot:5527392-Prymnesium_polylepis.1